MRSAFLPALLLANLAASGQSSTEAAKIKASAELVLVPVTVHKGETHVSGLKKENFTVLSDDRPQQLAVFEEVHAQKPTLTVSPGADEFTNVRYGQNAERLTVIALDLVNTAPLNQEYLKREIVKFPGTCGAARGALLAGGHYDERSARASGFHDRSEGNCRCAAQRAGTEQRERSHWRHGQPHS